MPDYVSNIYRKMINISASFTFVCRLSNRSNVSITGFISGGMTSNQCFVAGTAILTSSGYVAIENIRAGDMVWASDPETGETELKPVVRTFRNETTELVHVTVNGEEIICTKEHPFYSPVKGWTAACQLRAGDILVLVNGEYVVVEQAQHEILETPVATYNFEVQDFHTYYVGESAVLVHNLCGAKTPTSRPTSVADNKITGYTKHGLESAMGHDNHGIKPSAILDIVKHPTKVVDQASRGTIKYINEKGAVILNKAGKVVTTFAKSSRYWRF